MAVGSLALGFVAGLYIGIGLCIAVWTWFDPMPMDPTSRVDKAIIALIFIVGWMPLFGGVILQEEVF